MARNSPPVRANMPKRPTAGAKPGSGMLAKAFVPSTFTVARPTGETVMMTGTKRV